MVKLIYGVGFNDKSRPAANKDGVALKEYSLWIQMLNRCFSKKSLIRRPSYNGCYLSENFAQYRYFYDWCQVQIGFGKNRWQLDKDLLFVGNKLYSETTCIFVPQEINKFFIDSAAARGDYPIGVSFHKASGKYSSQCNVNGKRQHLGLFNTPEEAFAVYKPFKESLCKQLALKWQHEIDPRLFNAMMNWSVTYERTDR